VLSLHVLSEPLYAIVAVRTEWAKLDALLAKPLPGEPSAHFRLNSSGCYLLLEAKWYSLRDANREIRVCWGPLVRLRLLVKYELVVFLELI